MPHVIYRIENEKRVGPYHENNRYWEDKHKDLAINPPPIDEEWNSEIAREIAREMYNNTYRHNFKHVKFGFKAIENLKTWFSKTELQRLKEMKFEIVCITVPEAFFSKTQAMFVEENQERQIIAWEEVIK